MNLRSLLYLCLSWHVVTAAILSIDYGTEWTKAALVKPGIPLEIVLTKDTKRKEQSVIAFKGDERLYGGDAANLAARFPQHTYPALKTLLGQSYDSESARAYTTLYPATKMIRSGHDSIAFEHDSYIFTVEELVAMELINMRKNAELMAEGGVKDTIFTVPPHFNHKQRSALIHAAQLAELRPIELLNDGLSVAMDYAKSRTFNTSQIHAIFDMGAGSTSATIVKFESKSVKDVGRLNKTITTIEVLGTASTVDVSGNVMSERLYRYFVETFEATCDAKAREAFATNYRAHARLLKEATRIKQVLSANNEAVASVESLHDELDFKHKLSRTTFEELTSSLGPLTTGVVKSALQQAGLPMTDIQSLILHGGAARVPFVQSALLDVAAENQIARNVNADEAAVMGAVFRGAGLSGSFRVKELIITDISSSSFSYAIDAQKTLLFDAFSAYGTQKNLTFAQRTSDIDLTISSVVDESEIDLARYQIAGVSDASSELLKSHGCKSSDVVVATALDYSGLVSVSSAMAIAKSKDRPGVADKVKGWFGSKDTSESEKSDKQVNATEADQTTAKVSVKTVPLKLTSLTQTSIPSNDDKDLSLKKIASFERIDSDRIARETARNGLEAYIYKLRDLLENQSFNDFSTSPERQELQSLSADTTEWMYGQGETANLQDLVAKRKSMKDISDKVLFRQKESSGRQGKVDALQKQISSSRAFVKSQLGQIADYNTKKAELKKRSEAATTSATEDDSSVVDDDESKDNTTAQADKKEEEVDLFEPLYTESELTVLSGKLDHAEEWLSERIAEQEKLGSTADPVLLTTELDRRTSKLTDDFMYLLRKATYAEQSKAKLKSKSKAKSKPKSKPKSKVSNDTEAKAEKTEQDTTPQEDTSGSAEAPAEGAAAKPDVDESTTPQEPADPQPEAAAEADAAAHDEL